MDLSCNFNTEYIGGRFPNQKQKMSRKGGYFQKLSYGSETSENFH